MCDVLLLDDDPLVRLVMNDTLVDEGLEVREAANLDDARAALACEPVCRVLVADHDLGDPQKRDGFAFAAEAMQTRPELRVIYVTGRPHLLSALPADSRARGLPKPFLPTELLELTRELLDLARGPVRDLRRADPAAR